MERAPDDERVDALIARIAATQHGVVTLRQLWAAGLGNNAIYHRVRCGRLHRLYRGVYAVGHRHLTRDGCWLAAVLALGDGAALSHVSAAAAWGLRNSGATRIHVTVPTRGGRGHRAGITVHRSRTLRSQDVMIVEAIPVTTVARTLVDIAGTLAPGPLERAVERSLQLRLFDLLAIRALIEADPTRPGARTLERIVASIHDDPAPTRSELEARMRDLCEAHLIPRPEVNTMVDGDEVDFLWRAARLIVETDGHATHGTRATFERDRARDARHTTLGYRVVRFTHRRIMHKPDAVAAMLKVLLSAHPHASR
ncbi:MAG TPA: DUF559 domain-containing protein [Solirubrobacteraceae bacterium]|nr:DUF559 domain-containing protein [Solirubrobacteraceae bacterium]